MIERVVFIEFEDEAKDYMERNLDKGGGPKNSVIVPLSPASQLPFKMREIPHLNTVHFFDNAAHERALTQSEEWLLLLEWTASRDSLLTK